MLKTGLSLTVWALAAIATILAASGQVEFARWAGITDIRAFAVPAVLELVAVAFLLLGYRRARRGDSAGALWFLAAIVGGFAVYTNVAHSGGRAGLVFGAASALALILWFVKLRDDYRHFQRETGQATRPRPKLGALWAVAPRLAARAWVIAARRRISTVDEAVGYAEVWRAVYEDSRTAKVRRRLARRTAWRSVAEVAGGVVAELPRTAVVAAVEVVRHGQWTEPTQTTLSTERELPSSPPTADEGPNALRSEVFAFLDSRVSEEDYGDLGEDDPYLLWMTARALSVDTEEIAASVGDWCRQARRHAATNHRFARVDSSGS